MTVELTTPCAGEAACPACSAHKAACPASGADEDIGDENFPSMPPLTVAHGHGDDSLIGSDNGTLGMHGQD
jgi:hypothetical protein